MARINPVYVAALSHPLPVPNASSTSGNFFTNAAQDAQDTRDAVSQAMQDVRNRAQELRPVDLPEVNESGVMDGRAVYSGGGNVGGVIGGENEEGFYAPYKTQSEMPRKKEDPTTPPTTVSSTRIFGTGMLGGYIEKGKNFIKKLGKAFRISDRRLKTNIKLIGKSEQGYNIYSFKFIDPSYGEGTYQGVIADEMPEQVISKNEDGYNMVDYSVIDVEFKKIDEYSKVLKTNNKKMGKIIAKSGVELSTPARCRPAGKRVMTSRDMTVKSDLSVDNIMYKGNANLLAQR
tara:strand:- start:5749 stop:6615 length:867 start_codon:yes stop_codon:yes gene_type:complete